MNSVIQFPITKKTSSSRSIFRVIGLLWGRPQVTGVFPSQSPLMRSFDIFFGLCLNNRLSKQLSGQWFETSLHSLWRRCNDNGKAGRIYTDNKYVKWSNLKAQHCKNGITNAQNIHLPLMPHICQRTGSALVQIMACSLFGAMPLSKRMLGYMQLHPQEELLWILIKIHNFHSRKCIKIYRLRNGSHFAQGG